MFVLLWVLIEIGLPKIPMPDHIGEYMNDIVVGMIQSYIGLVNKWYSCNIRFQIKK